MGAEASLGASVSPQADAPRRPTVLLKIPATDSYTGLIEPIFMFYAGPAASAGRAAGAPPQSASRRITVRNTVSRGAYVQGAARNGYKCGGQ